MKGQIASGHSEIKVSVCLGIRVTMLRNPSAQNVLVDDSKRVLSGRDAFDYALFILVWPILRHTLPFYADLHVGVLTIYIPLRTT